MRHTHERNPVPAAVDLHTAPQLLVSAEAGAGMSFFELDCYRPNIGLTTPVRADAFLIALQLKTCPDFDLYAAGRPVQPRNFDAGAVAIFDLRTNLVTDLRDPFHAVNFYLPAVALGAISDAHGHPRIDELRHTPGTAVRDATIVNLLLAMRPALAASPEQASVLFVDHVAQALAGHVARTYGGLVPAPANSRGGLAPLHTRRIKELLDANLCGRVLLEDLARVCDLSVRQFTRAFRQTTGMAPHQWLVQRRIERAKELLGRSARPLSMVASDCGFADQSHFTRAFTRATGVSPGAWRRERGR